MIPSKNIDTDIHLEYYEKTLMKSNVKLDDETKNNFKKLLKLSDIKYSKYTSIKVLELFEKSKIAQKTLSPISHWSQTPLN